MTTGLENKQAVEDAVSHAHVGVCPMDAPPALYAAQGFDLREEGWLRFLHWEWLKRNPEVECSCR